MSKQPEDIVKRLEAAAKNESKPGVMQDYYHDDLLREAATLITSLREALDGVLAEADRDTRAFRRAREALREQS